MKIAHISDLHLGKIVHGYNMLKEQEIILKQVISMLKENNIQTLIIAGDIYDRPVASSDAIVLFEEFLEKLVHLNVTCLIIGGNHDGYARLAYAKKYLKLANIHIKADYQTPYEKIVIEDVNFYLINHLEPINLNILNDLNLKTHDEMYEYIASTMEIDKLQKNILIAHGYFASIKGGNHKEETDLEFSDSERELSIGTTDIVSLDYFKDFNYVALGHLHKHQQHQNAFYSGSIYQYSFSEHPNKGMYVINTDDWSTDFVKFDLKRKLKTLKGSFEEIMSPNVPSSEDYIEIILLGEEVISNLMDKVKQKFPNTMLVRKDTNLSSNNIINTEKGVIKLSMDDQFKNFAQNIYQSKLTMAEQEIFAKLISEKGDEDEAN